MRLLSDHDVWHAIEDVEGIGLLVVTASGCGACRRLAGLLRTLEADGSLHGLALLRVDAERAPGLIEELEVFHLPALVAVRGGAPAEAVHSVLGEGPLRTALAHLRQATGPVR